MQSDTLMRVLIIGGLVTGIAAVTMLSRQEAEKPQIKPVKPVAERRQMPDFAWQSMSGHKWALNDQKGKIVLVNFWATWCSPCKQETPDLVRVYEKYRGRGVTFAAITMDDEPARVVPRFVERYRVEYPVLVPPSDSPITGNIESIPTSFLIDRHGRIARTWVGLLHEEELVHNIEELLAEPTGAA